MLPVWDVCCGIYAVLAVVVAVRCRDQSGVGVHISLALEDVALATARHFGLLTLSTQRPRFDNAIYGHYGHDCI